MSDITLLMQAFVRGEEQSSDKLLPLVYDELRNLAAMRMAHEAAGHTLQPTALVHEAWVRLLQNGSSIWQSRAHFFGAASEAMRRILIERARRKARLKRGGDQERVNIEFVDLAEATPDDKLLLVDEALAELEAQDPERARVVIHKFFGGLTNEETAEAIGISRRSVDRHWLCARTWLFWKLKGEL